MGQTGKDQDREGWSALCMQRNSINNPAGLPTLRATYGLLGKWLEFAQWKSGQILLQDEEITFQLLRGVNYLVFPGELGYQREILQTRSQVCGISLFSFKVAE